MYCLNRSFATVHLPQVSGQEHAETHLSFLASILEPLVDGYWLVCSSLLLLPEATTQGTSGELYLLVVVGRERGNTWGGGEGTCGEREGTCEGLRWVGGGEAEIGGERLRKSCFMCAEADLLTQLHKTAQIKASKGLLTRGNEHTHTSPLQAGKVLLISLSLSLLPPSLSPFPSPTAPPPVESCSMDTLRNSLKILQDLNVLVAVGSSGALKVGNTSRLVDIIKILTRLRS